MGWGLRELPTCTLLYNTAMYAMFAYAREGRYAPLRDISMRAKCGNVKMYVCLAMLLLRYGTKNYRKKEKNKIKKV